MARIRSHGLDRVVNQRDLILFLVIMRDESWSLKSINHISYYPQYFLERIRDACTRREFLPILTFNLKIDPFVNGNSYPCDSAKIITLVETAG